MATGEYVDYRTIDDWINTNTKFIDAGAATFNVESGRFISFAGSGFEMGQYTAKVLLIDSIKKGEKLSEMKVRNFMPQQLFFNHGRAKIIFEARNFRALRADIFKTYEDDFIRYFSLDDVNLFRRSLTAVAQNVGSPSKDSHVVCVDRPGYKRVGGILARLEKWRLIIKIDQLGIEPEQNMFHPKHYLYDIGTNHAAATKSDSRCNSHPPCST